jgi:hypothetical protein
VREQRRFGKLVIVSERSIGPQCASGELAVSYLSSVPLKALDVLALRIALGVVIVHDLGATAFVVSTQLVEEILPDLLACSIVKFLVPE